MTASVRLAPTMAGRFSSLFARRPRPMGDRGSPPEREAAPTDAPPAVPPPPPPVPARRSAASLQRERRELLRQREIEIRDVGGLAVEMARRDAWRQELLAARTAEVLGIEERVQELDAMLTTTEIAARGVRTDQCACGAPVVRGAHFCSHCGRPATETPPVATCSRCGQPLAADVNFCPVCGNAVAAEEFDTEEPVESTSVEASPGRKGRRGAS